MTRTVLLALAVALLGQAPAQATPVPGLAEELSALGRTATLATAQSAADALRQRFGLAAMAGPAPTAAAPAFAVGGTPVVELVDMRLLLAQIAVQTGAKDHLALARAQDDGVHQVILLRGGNVTLAGLATLMAASPAAGFVSADASGTTLTRALVVWSDAGLTLGQGDTLNLSRADGSFLANLGWLDIHGATLRGTEATNLREPAFRPFVLTAGRGSLTVTDASFAHLGFGETQRFGGVSVDNSGLQPPRLPPVVTASRFEDVATLALINTTSAQVTANRIKSGAILVAHSVQAQVKGNLLTEALGQAIRISNASADAVVTDNVVLGALSGLTVDQASHRVTLSGNVLGGQSSSGIRLDKVDCVQVTGNLTALGAGSGVSLSNTGRVVIAGNAVFDNSGAGILLRDQRNKARVTVSGNQIAGNHEGLRGATAGDVTVAGNDLERQLPRLFAGDLSLRTIAWLEDRRTHGPQALLADPEPVCPDEGNI
jgi:poly(beta-D-mannuronate) C5 epimerase